MRVPMGTVRLQARSRIFPAFSLLAVHPGCGHQPHTNHGEIGLDGLHLSIPYKAMNPRRMFHPTIECFAMPLKQLAFRMVCTRSRIFFSVEPAAWVMLKV